VESLDHVTPRYLGHPMKSGLEAGFLLDRLWHQIRGELEQSKRPALLALAEVLADAAVPYAIIGGLALQMHQAEPRTTLVIDVAVHDRQSCLAPRWSRRGCATPATSRIHRTGSARTASRCSSRTILLWRQPSIARK